LLCQVDKEFYFNNSYKKQTAKILEIKPHDESKIVLVSLFKFMMS